MAETKSDETLLTEFVKGRRAALGELARRYEQALLGLTGGLLGGRQDLARDAVQETWVRVIRFGERFDGRSRFKTWLYRIAINRCHSLSAEAAEWAASSQRNENAAEIEVSLEREDRKTTQPDRAAQTAERDGALRRTVEQLGPDKRNVLLLCYHKGLTHPEAAEILDIPIGTLKSRLNAALEELRGRLSSEMNP
ncbi:MAG: RNA polymerase sigma factor [Phycisphaerae bacterium]